MDIKSFSHLLHPIFFINIADFRLIFQILTFLKISFVMNGFAL